MLTRRSFFRGVLGLAAAVALPVGAAFGERRPLRYAPRHKLPPVSMRRLNQGVQPSRMKSVWIPVGERLPEDAS
jgi:hypothetical protein